MGLPFHLRAVLIALGVVGCVDAPPRAIVRASPGTASLGRAVLVMPTRCESALGEMSCAPATYEAGQPAGLRRPLPGSFAALIAPSLRLKLEFAGYTLAEAAVMMVTTRDRIETRATTSTNDRLPSATTGSEVAPGLTLAELAEPDIVEVARSLHLAGIVTSMLRVSSAPHFGLQFSLTVTLRELDRLEPVWSVTCSELYLDTVATSKLLGNCVGNGVLAAYAPDNLMGRPL
ncbi:hypothetical protein BH11MYX1_BH11MYX1_03620 [soil metagenome]